MSRPARAVPDPAGLRLGPYWLTPGIGRGNAMILMFSGLCLICLFTFNAFAQPYLLREVLLIPDNRQGAITGTLGFVQEAVVILLVSLVGATSDKLGRRTVFVAGVVLLAAGFALYPMATTVPQLFGLRIFYALGFAAASVMLHVCLAEYSQDATRGRWMGTAGICNGLGVVIMALLLSRLPSWYENLGFDSVLAIRLSYWTFAAYLLLLAVLLSLGLARSRPVVSRRESSLRIAIRGFTAARENPRILLGYGMAFASRGDLAILTTFFALWLVQRGTELGLTAAESTAKAGMLFGLSQAVGLLWSYPVGLILDRLPRLTGMALAFGLASLGYFAIGQISDPFAGPGILLACVLVGMGESSAVVAAGVLIGQEAPASQRGAVLGTFSLMGATGIMVLTFLGGVVFDRVGQTAPFTMMGLVNFAILLGVLTLRSREGRPGLAPAKSQSESG